MNIHSNPLQDGRSEDALQQDVQHAARLQEIAADPAWVAVVERLKRRYYGEFIIAEGAEALVAVHARVHLLDDLLQEMKGGINRGTLAQNTLDTRAKQAALVEQRENERARRRR